jgi:hypothetical protein
MKTLNKYAIDASKVTFAAASGVIDAIQQNGWRPLPAAQLADLLQRQPGDELW